MISRNVFIKSLNKQLGSFYNEMVTLGGHQLKQMFGDGVELIHENMVYNIKLKCPLNTNEHIIIPICYLLVSHY